MWVVLRPILLKRRETVPSLIVKSSWYLPNRKTKRKERLITKNYDAITIKKNMTRNYHRKLSVSILSRRKCGNYRDTGVSNIQLFSLLQMKFGWFMTFRYTPTFIIMFLFNIYLLISNLIFTFNTLISYQYFWKSLINWNNYRQDTLRSWEFWLKDRVKEMAVNQFLL